MKRTNIKRKHFSKKHPESTNILGIAWYRREEWSHLLESAADRNEPEDTYEEWLHNANAHLHEMAEAGINAMQVYINVDELQDWCIRHGRPVDGNAHAFFTVEKLQQLQKGKTKEV